MITSRQEWVKPGVCKHDLDWRDGSLVPRLSPRANEKYCKRRKGGRGLGTRDGTLSSSTSTTQRAMTLGLALDESRRTADSSGVVTPPLVLELQSFESPCMLATLTI